MINRIIKFTIASLKMTFRNRFAIISSFIFPIAIMLAFSLYNSNSTPKISIELIYSKQAKSFAQNIIKNSKNFGTVKVVSNFSKALKNVKNGNNDLLIDVSTSNSTKRLYPQGPIVSPDSKPVSINPGGTMIPASKSTSGLTPNVKLLHYSFLNNYNVSFYIDKTSSDILETDLFVTNFKYNLLKSNSLNTEFSPFKFKTELVSSNGKSYNYLDFLVPGILALSLMQGVIFAVINIIVNYKELGILRRLAVTPLSKSDFIAALTLTRLIFALIQVAILIVIASVFIHVVPLGGILGFINLAIVVILGSLMFVTLALLISTISNKTETVFPLANLITLPMLFLSGVFFAVNSFPSWLQDIVKFFPLTYLANSLRGVYEHGYSLLTLHNQIEGMIAWIIILFILNVIFFKWE